MLPDEVRKIVFDWSRLVKENSCINALAFGYGSMYNHNENANLRYEANPDKQTILFIAVRDIKANEELTINYDENQGKTKGSNSSWFKRMGVAPVKKDEHFLLWKMRLVFWKISSFL